MQNKTDKLDFCKEKVEAMPLSGKDAATWDDLCSLASALAPMLHLLIILQHYTGDTVLSMYDNVQLCTAH